MHKEVGHGQLLVQALEHLKAAIDLLDRAQAPAHIAAHVDLAAHQLRDKIGCEKPADKSDQMAKKAELH